MSRWRALVTLEVRQQLRDPLTALYAIIFGALCIGFISSGAVELVGQRDGVPKTSPWSLALAFGGLTAFGQVITTMVVATAFLRDSAMRTDALLATTGIGARLWFSARMTAALGVLCIVYAAMPIGTLVGAIVADIARSSSATSILAQCITLAATLLRTWLLITLPTCLIVAALLGAAAVFTQRTMGVLAVALTLVALWQLALGLEAHEATRHVGALLDPFANAPVLAITRAWSPEERTTRAIQWAGELLFNRLLWITVAAAVIATTAYFARWPNAVVAANDYGQGSLQRASRSLLQDVLRNSFHHDAQHDAQHDVEHDVEHDVARSADSVRQSPQHALMSLTARWMQRDGGWRVVAWLAALNASANAWSRSTATSTTADVLGLVAEHSRLFLILLATVYAGEVLWRDRDLRIDALGDTMPISTRAMAIGRLTGLFRAQLTVVFAIAFAAVVVLIARALAAPTNTTLSASLAALGTAWIVFGIWLPFAQLAGLSVAVHAIVNHKVLAHLLLITGWVAAVTLDRHGASAWWYRFAESAPLLEAGQVNWSTLALHALWWSALSVLLLGVAVIRWPRGVRASRMSRRLTSRR